MTCKLAVSAKGKSIEVTDLTGDDDDVEVGLPSGYLENNNGLSVDNRLKRKAKRLTKMISVHENKVGNSNNIGSCLRYSKNSRRSRNRYGRGLPKKGGAGGKGTWGEPGSELTVELEVYAAAATDSRDPNYDDEEDTGVFYDAILPELTEDDLENILDPSILEYFENGDTQEVIMWLEDLNLENLRPVLVVIIINYALERKASQREMTSVLLSDMYGKILHDDDIAEGLEMLLKELPDILLDTPDAATALGNFIARAIADDCVPPKFIEESRQKFYDCSIVKTALDHADNLLNMKHGLVRLDNVWGVVGGMRPVRCLITQMQLLLKEYLHSGDVTEACRCIQELEVPHFHHELIYEALVMVIEAMREPVMDLMCRLFLVLAQTFIVTPDQMCRGFYRVYSEMHELSLDVPRAYQVLEHFLVKCEAAKFVSAEVIKNMPTRGRKRYVSEGDGGAEKPSYFA